MRRGRLHARAGPLRPFGDCRRLVARDARTESHADDLRLGPLRGGDLFDWRSDRTYDTVFFANWLSHVPPSMFERFWDLVQECVRPGGRVGFLDEDERAAGYDECRVVDGVPVATRTLADGRRFDIVKVFWHPDDLAARLVTLGWKATLRRVDASYFLGVAERG